MSDDIEPTDSAPDGEHGSSLPEGIGTQKVATVLMEVAPGVAAVFGEVPDGMDVASLGLLPSRDRRVLADAAGAAGVAGLLVDGAVKAQGLYRLAPESAALLGQGGTLAVKDGASLGAIMGPDGIMGQARFLKVAGGPGMLAGAGAMAAITASLTLQLKEISAAVEQNIQLTEQILGESRQERWATLRGMARTVDEAVRQAEERGEVTDAIWSSISGNGPEANSHFELFQGLVRTHTAKLRTLEGKELRQYLATNIGAIRTDAQALVISLRMRLSYQVLRAGWARASDGDDASAEIIVRDARHDAEQSMTVVRGLLDGLDRELRLVHRAAGGGVSVFGGDPKTRRAAGALADGLEPLCLALRGGASLLPAVLCGPADTDLSLYPAALSRYFDEGEELLGMAFASQVDDHGVTAALTGLKPLSDTAWKALGTSALSVAVSSTVPCACIGVTNRRVLAIDVADLLARGGKARQPETIPLADVRFVRPPAEHRDLTRAAVSLSLRDRDVRWVFPKDAPVEDVERFATLIETAVKQSDTMPELSERVAGGQHSQEAVDDGQ